MTNFNFDRQVKTLIQDHREWFKHLYRDEQPPVEVLAAYYDKQFSLALMMRIVEESTLPILVQLSDDFLKDSDDPEFGIVLKDSVLVDYYNAVNYAVGRLKDEKFNETLVVMTRLADRSPTVSADDVWKQLDDE